MALEVNLDQQSARGVLHCPTVHAIMIPLVPKIEKQLTSPVLREKQMISPGNV